MDEARYYQVIRDGERNKEVAELIRNWCSHARVSNMGGVGLIAQQTGLPIGHFAMECDFAPASGFAGWYLESCALDFHDRNCAHCDKRQAVRIPNLSILVEQRAREASRQQEEVDCAKAELQAALEARKKQREDLRVGQSAAVRALLDDLDTLDATHADDAKTRVIETVRLAPEVLTSSLTDYFFELTASPEAGCQDVALQALKYAKANPARLADAALQCLAKHTAVQTAAYIIMETPELADEQTMEAAVPALICLARAPRSEFGHGDERVFHPSPLKAVFAVWPEAICRAIQRLLDSRSSYAIRMGTAGLKVLSVQAPNLLDRFSRLLVTKLTRAHLLIDDSDADRERRMVCSDLQRAVAAALRHAPAETDKLIATYFEGAAAEGEARLVRAYGEIFRTSLANEDALDGDVAATALKRFVAWSSTSKNVTVLTEITQTLRSYCEVTAHSVDDVLDIALGATAVMDARIEAFDAERSLISKSESFLDVLEAQNARMALYYSREVFAAIAAAAASRSQAAAESYVDFLSKIDGGRDTLIVVLLEESSKLVATPEGLRLVLPELYTAMVGTSTLVRASAAETLGRVGRIRSNDLPELVLEAFILLLEDQYVIVHKAAAKALESIALTDALEQRAGRALLMLLYVYGDKGVESFLLKWMQLYFRRYTADDASRANLARWCLKVLKDVPVHMHLRELNSLSKYLKCQPAYVDLVIRALEDPEVSDYGQEDVIRLLYLIPATEASKRSADLSKLSARLTDSDRYVDAIVEVLTRVGAWDEAVEVVESSWEAVPDTVPKRRLKWFRRLHVVAVQFEAAIAAGDLSRQDALKAEWEGLYQLLKEDQEKYAERRNPFPGVFRSNSGS